MNIFRTLNSNVSREEKKKRTTLKDLFRKKRITVTETLGSEKYELGNFTIQLFFR